MCEPAGRQNTWHPGGTPPLYGHCHYAYQASYNAKTPPAWEALLPFPPAIQPISLVRPFVPRSIAPFPKEGAAW